MYLCFRSGLQVTQPVAKPLSSQAELAILFLDAGHALEHHFIILSRQKQTSVSASVQSIDVRRKRTTIHEHFLIH